MFNQNLSGLLRRTLLAMTTSLTIFALPIYALSGDKNLPAQFVSDNAVYNSKAGVSVFTGNVQMNQGSSRLTGDKITVITDEKGKIIQIISIGKQAHYSTLPDNQTKILDAYADTIEYYPQKDEAILIGNGEIRQGKNSLKGPKIVYNLQQRILVAKSDELPNKTNRSVIVINPNELPGH